MPNYRVPYGKIPWSIIIAMVLSKAITFFLVSPCKWVEHHGWIKNTMIVTGVLGLFMTVAEVATRIINGTSLLSEIRVALGL